MHVACPSLNSVLTGFREICCARTRQVVRASTKLDKVCAIPDAWASFSVVNSTRICQVLLATSLTTLAQDGRCYTWRITNRDVAAAGTFIYSKCCCVHWRCCGIWQINEVDSGWCLNVFVVRGTIERHSQRFLTLNMRFCFRVQCLIHRFVSDEMIVHSLGRGTNEKRCSSRSRRIFHRVALSINSAFAAITLVVVDDFRLNTRIILRESQRELERRLIDNLKSHFVIQVVCGLCLCVVWWTLHAGQVLGSWLGLSHHVRDLRSVLDLRCSRRYYWRLQQPLLNFSESVRMTFRVRVVDDFFVFWLLFRLSVRLRWCCLLRRFLLRCAFFERRPCILFLLQKLSRAIRGLFLTFRWWRFQYGWDSSWKSGTCCGVG